jgi:hypothetical protein
MRITCRPAISRWPTCSDSVLYRPCAYYSYSFYSYSLIFPWKGECGLRIVEALCGCIESAAEVERAARAYMEILRAFPNRSLPLLFSLIADEVRATGTTPAVAVTSNIDLAL